jgi:hypothetical protein
MPSEMNCPACGRPVRLDEASAETVGPVPEGARTIEVLIPGTVSSLDEADLPGVSLATPAADHVLGAFVRNDTGSNGSVQTGPELAPQSVEVAYPPARGPVPSLLDDPLSALRLDSTTSAPGIETSDDDLVYEPSEGPPAWAWVLLASYASAITLALGWMFFTGRVRLRHEPVQNTIPADSRPDLELREDRSQRVVPLPPISPDRITTLGQALRIGEIEFTPLGVWAAAVTLRRLPLDAKPETRKGGENALFLKIRLRNLSASAVFAPFEEAFVRERDRGFPESCIETGGADRITIYPLARESEWAIKGQAFRDLRPGETLETVVVSQPDALGRATQEMTWRIKLRTGVDFTEVVGVRFGDHEISTDGG